MNHKQEIELKSRNKCPNCDALKLIASEMCRSCRKIEGNQLKSWKTIRGSANCKKCSKPMKRYSYKGLCYHCHFGLASREEVGQWKKAVIEDLVEFA